MMKISHSCIIPPKEEIQALHIIQNHFFPVFPTLQTMKLEWVLRLKHITSGQSEYDKEGSEIVRDKLCP